MGMTANAIASRGLVPVAPFRKLIQDWDRRNTDFYELAGRGSGFLTNMAKLENLTGLSKDFLTCVLKERKKFIGFDNADRLVITLHKDGPFGWHVEEELREIYDSFDLSPLDKSKPTTRLAA